MATLEVLQDRLAKCQAAIDMIEATATQMYSEGGDQHLAPRLEVLYAERTKLDQQIAAKQGAGRSMRRVRIID